MNTKVNKGLFINIGASIVSFFVQIIISFYLSPYIIAQLGEESYGFISLANNFVSYASLISGAINAMAQRHISICYNQENYKEANSYYSSIFVLDLGISVFITILAGVLVANISVLNITPEIVGEVRITFILTFANFIVSLIGTIFRVATFCTNRMELDSARQIFANIIQVILAVGLYTILDPKNYYLSFAVLVSGLMVFLMNIYLTHKLTPELKIKKSLVQLKKLIVLVRDSVWIFVSNISNLLLTGVDLIIANLYIDGVIMGRLSIAKQIPAAIGSLLATLATIFQASFTKYVANNDKLGLLEEMKFTLKILAMMLTVPFAGVIVYGIPFLELWLRARHFTDAQIMQIYILMLLELINIIANAYMYSVHSLFIAYNKVKYYSIFILVGSVISVTLTLVLVSTTNLGVYAIAGTSTIVLALINGILVPTYASSVLEVKWNTILKIVGKSYLVLLAIIILFLPLRMICSIGNWGMFILVVLFDAMIGYFVSFVLLLNKNEKQKVLSYIRKKKKA